MATTALAKKKKTGDTASKSDLTRQRIVDAAARMFASKGYAHTRLSDIAREAQTHAGGIYYYFSSREQLVDEVLRVSTTRTIESVNTKLAQLPEGATTEDRILAAVTGQINEILAFDSYTAAYLKIYSQIPEAIKKRHRTVLREFFDIWRRIIRTGQQNGEIRTDIDAAVLRLAIVGSIQWSVEWVDPKTSSAETLGREMTKLFFSGMKA